MKDEQPWQPRTFHLPSFLEARAERARGVRKRIRTRYRLLAATAAEMEQVGYEGLAIEGIVERAGLARGTFYLYFANRSDAAMAVNRSFRALMRSHRPRASRHLSAYEAIYRVNRFYVACYARNARILAGSEALKRDRPDLACWMDFLNHRWSRVILRDLERRLGTASGLGERPEALLAMRAIIGMADELLRETYVHAQPRLAAVAPNEEAVCRALTAIWYRALYAHAPDGYPDVLPSGRPRTAAPSPQLP